jgi:hypothetical protein
MQKLCYSLPFLLSVGIFLKINGKKYIKTSLGLSRLR